MRSIRRILVAVKEPKAKHLSAVAKAAQIARALGAKIELFHDLDIPLYPYSIGGKDGEPQQIARKLRQEVLIQLEAIAEKVRKHGVTVTSAAEWDFPPHEAIIRRASSIRADLIVTQCHAEHRFARTLLRLTDWELLRSSPMPVLLIKNSRPYRRPAVLAALDPMHAFAKPSNLDNEILSAAHALTQAMRGTLHAVHAFMPVSDGLLTPQVLNPQLATDLHQKIESEARARFETALARVSIPRTRKHLVGRHPQDAIAQVVRKTRSAIVVMGSISRTGLKRVFIGNTAERLLDDLPCDVLVVKPRQFKSRVPRGRRGIHFVAPVPF